MDIDIDCKDKKQILKYFKYIPASIVDKEKNTIDQHIAGVYFHEVPVDKFSNSCSINYKEAEKIFNFQKIDFLHNTIYDMFCKRSDIEQILKLEPNWKLLEDKSVVETLPHIHKYYNLLQQWKPKNIPELAMFIALIRPDKQYLKDINNFEMIKDVIWIKEEDSKFAFKKSHATAYAVAIKLMLNVITLKMNLQRQKG